MTRTRKQSKSRPGQVRIIGGQWRGRKLPVAEVKGLRPTSDRARETLFNWLQPQVSGARVLDLCAGTGVLGLEALSRGASDAVFVELDPGAVRMLKECVEILSAGNQAQISQADVFNWLKSSEIEAFDLIFIDPPYASGLHQKLLDSIVERQLLVPGGLLYLETDTQQPGIQFPPGWQRHRDKTIGQIRMQLLAGG